MKRITYISAHVLTFCLIVICNIAFSQTTPDPGLNGPYTVLQQDYDLGDLAFDPPTFPDDVEVIGRVYYPSDMSSGPFPVLVFLHGRHETCYDPGNNSSNSSWPCSGGDEMIPSYQGYDYLAQKMASHGYIVISVSANAINATDNDVTDYGMRARGELVQHHLDLWNTYNTVGGGPFGTLFVGKLDLSRVGTMGHSRGGEGVVEHALLNIEQGSPYGVKAVLTLAPVDFARKTLVNIPLMNVAPYCDGDVSNLQGIHYYDDTRYLDPNDEAPKHSVLMMGANHNYYNTVWTPATFPAGSADDWDYEDWMGTDPYCSESVSGNGRLDPPTQQAALTAYLCAFFRRYVGEETQFAPILETDDVVPPVSSLLNSDQVFMSYHPANSKRLDVNRMTSTSCETENTLMGAAGQTGLVNYGICSGYCLSGGTAQEPHGSSGLSLSQLQIGWNSAADNYTNTLPDGFNDLTQFNALQFRAGVNFEDYTATADLNFSVQLIDSYGATATQTVSSHSSVLFAPPGTLNNTLPKLLHNTIKIDLASFTGIDMTSVSQIRFLFNQSAVGAIMISDIILSSANEVSFPPVANFSANVTETCTGQVTFTDNSVFSPDTWTWDFGDGTTSDVESPLHVYSENGVYTVKLVVENAAGADSITKYSYVTVNRPDAPFVNGDEVCPGEMAFLSATSGSAGLLSWYDSEAGGMVVATGGAYNPVVDNTTSWFVEEEVVGMQYSVGPPDNTFGSGGNFNSNDLRGIFFDAYDFFTLESVKVYSASAGNRTIEVLDGDGGNVIHSYTVYIGSGEQVVPLGFFIAPYSGYYLKVTGSLIDLFRINDGSPTYPYTVPGLVSLTGSNVAGQELDFYYYFFDWKVREKSCISLRAEVTAVVNPLPAVTVSDDVTITIGGSTILNASGGVTYTWSPSAGLSSSTVSNPVASPTETTLYTVTVTDENGCSDTASVLVTVVPVGIETIENERITISPNPATTSVKIIATEEILMTEVFSADGRKIALFRNESRRNIQEIEFKDLARGVYYLKVITVKNSGVKRIALE
ncbi:MAG: hypothetical protein A2W91_13715 [Bacteroidetes bacterium GWF2_38_335]|nr:MAG: hypothetical protein A2W91_13715 [Bacteroidetes bacterium GWF2_38_335]OFY77774.1 MAG: hypothetical protein A2281_15405 [Bacteroidetes bacterium RIFOXYA12_FULL_38_20]HBS87422.1 hypothetical protein [Bacteroidales bacterium]